MNFLRTAAILALTGLAAATAVHAEVFTYSIKPEGDNQVVFVSRAVGETFEGRTRKISGSFSCDPDDLSRPVSGHIEIDVKTLDTGIAIRNNHMFQNHLHPEQYPTMSFDLEKLAGAPASLTAGQRVLLKAQGRFTCHGVTREIQPELQVTRHADGSLSVVAEWIVTLKDYSIERPQFLVVKLAEDQEVSASFTAMPQ